MEQHEELPADGEHRNRHGDMRDSNIGSSSGWCNAVDIQEMEKYWPEVDCPARREGLSVTAIGCAEQSFRKGSTLRLSSPEWSKWQRQHDSGCCRVDLTRGCQVFMDHTVLHIHKSWPGRQDSPPWAHGHTHNLQTHWTAVQWIWENALW